MPAAPCTRGARSPPAIPPGVLPPGQAGSPGLLEATGAAGSCRTGSCWGERELQERHERAPRAGRLPRRCRAAWRALQSSGKKLHENKSLEQQPGELHGQQSRSPELAASPTAGQPHPGPGAAPERAAAAGAATGQVGARAPRAPRLLPLPAQPGRVPRDQHCPGAGPAPLSAPQDRGPGAPRVPQRRCSARRLAAVPAGQVFCRRLLRSRLLLPGRQPGASRYLILGDCATARRGSLARPVPYEPPGRQSPPAWPAPPGEELKAQRGGPARAEPAPLHHAQGQQRARPRRAPGSLGRAAASIRPECHDESRRVPGPSDRRSELHSGVPVRW
ncbi:atherin-like isoform X1 [Oxyura jamaicensis]|uniref:atherin-like isoform X1 n=1 Tax=Oxyura jamaicensis TaxID=8884 RepID=UPI0015A5CFEB|nr:atherin-like isoform X1 [Oxyura jamaicensis]